MKAKISLIKTEAEVEASKKEIETFFDGVVPETIKELGGIMTDTVKYWRFKNQVKILKKANKIIKENHLEKHQVPLKILVPLLESASLEEEGALQDMWANLLVNATTGEVNMRAIFISILKEISPVEATILSKLSIEKITDEGILLKNLEKEIDKEIIIIAIYNLRRLNLLRNKLYQGKPTNRLARAISDLYASGSRRSNYWSAALPTYSLYDPNFGENETDDKEELRKRVEELENERENKETVEKEIELTPLAAALLRACTAPQK